MIKKTLIFFFTLSLLSGCANLPTKTLVSNSQITVPDTSTHTGNMIAVNILLLTPLAESENILLAKLDALTGAWIDPQFFPIIKLDETHYQAQIPKDAAGLFRYKYLKVAGDQVEEVNSAGEAFSFRILDTSSVSEITDVISGWQEGSAQHSTGRLVGTVRSSSGDAVLGGIRVISQGREAVTDVFGRYEISGLPDGTYFVRFSGSAQSFIDFQQLATIQAGSVTVADVWLKDADYVKVAFNLNVHPDQKTASNIYLIGDVPALGFESNSLQQVIPLTAIKLDRISDTQYQAVVDLPAGTSIQYKYTIGDGYWGSERGNGGGLMTRSLVVPTNDFSVTDSLGNWGGELKQIKVHNSVQISPEYPITIQFNAFEWSQPIPLTPMPDGVYLIDLVRPTELITDAQVKVCAGAFEVKNCAVFDGNESAVISFTSAESVDLPVNAWEGDFPSSERSNFEAGDLSSEAPEVGYSLNSFLRGKDFLAAVAAGGFNIINGEVVVVELAARMVDDGYRFATEYEGLSIGDFSLPIGLAELRSAGADPWLYVNVESMETEIGVTNSEPDVDEINRFSAQLDEQLINLVQVANLSGIDTIVIGGSGLTNSMPGAFPVDAATKVWQNAIAKTREHFSGQIYLSVNYNNFGLNGLPAFDLDIDGYVIDWATGVSVSEGQSIEELTANINLMLDYDIIPAIPLGGRIIIRANIPSNGGVLLGCANNHTINCVVADGGMDKVNEDAQGLVYQAFMTALSGRTDVEGFISGGFDPLAARIDSSASIFGKPAMADFNRWIESVNNQ